MHLCAVTWCKSAALSPPVFSCNGLKSGKCRSVFLSVVLWRRREHRTTCGSNAHQVKAGGVCITPWLPRQCSDVVLCDTEQTLTLSCCPSELGFHDLSEYFHLFKNTFRHTCAHTHTKLGENWMEGNEKPTCVFSVFSYMHSLYFKIMKFSPILF